MPPSPRKDFHNTQHMSSKMPCKTYIDAATTVAFIAFLRAEADAAEDHAKRLNAQADKLVQDFGLTNIVDRSGECHLHIQRLSVGFVLLLMNL